MARNEFKKIVLITSLLCMAACAGSRVMTKDDFYAIELGESSQTVIEKYGEPYSIRKKKDGSQEYRYIERIPAAEETAEQRIYLITVKNGQVVSKKFSYEVPPAYDEIYDEDPNDVPN